MSATEAIAIAINLAALVFLGAQVMLARKALTDAAGGQRQEWERQRRKSSIEASIATARYRESLKAVLPWNDRDPKGVTAFLEDAKGDHEKLAPLRQYLNHLENLAIGVKQGVFDLETISMIQGSRTIDVVTNYGPYIEGIRRELDRPATYQELEELAELLKTLRQGTASASGGPSPSTLPAGRWWPWLKLTHKRPSAGLDELGPRQREEGK